MFTGTFALVVLAASAAGAAWVGYFRWKDRARPEPVWLMVAAVGGGAVAVALSAFGYDELDRWGVEIVWSSLEAGGAAAVGAALLIGLIEEGTKALVVLPLALFCRHFDEWMDGAIYAGCAGIGFSLAETALHGWGGFTALELWPRILAAPLTHALFAVPVGLGIAVAVLGRRPLWAFVGLAVSAIAHGGYDLALARSGMMGIFSAAIVLALWVALIVAVPKIAALPQARRVRQA